MGGQSGGGRGGGMGGIRLIVCPKLSLSMRSVGQTLPTLPNWGGRWCVDGAGGEVPVQGVAPAAGVWWGLGGVPEPALGGAVVLAAVEGDEAVRGRGGRASGRFGGGWCVAGVGPTWTWTLGKVFQSLFTTSLWPSRKKFLSLLCRKTVHLLQLLF